MKRLYAILAALSGATAVGLGAFGAHGLETMLEESGRVATWDTAVLYHLVHSVVLLQLCQQQEMKSQGYRAKGRGLSFWLFLTGVVVFSGTLYLLCLSGITWLGAITPVGGLALIAGWLSLIPPTSRRP